MYIRGSFECFIKVLFASAAVSKCKRATPFAQTTFDKKKAT